MLPATPAKQPTTYRDIAPRIAVSCESCHIVLLNGLRLR
jgi:hypothetical protein